MARILDLLEHPLSKSWLCGGEVVMLKGEGARGGVRGNSCVYDLCSCVTVS